MTSSERLSASVLIYLLCVLVPLGINVGPLMLSLMRILLLLLVIPMTVSLLSGRYGRLMPVDILFALHIAWAAVALAMNNPDRVIEQIGSVGMEFWGGYLIGRAYIRSPSQFIALARALGIIIACLLPFTVFETVTGRSLLLELMRKLPTFRAPPSLSIGGRLGLERVQSTFVHPIHWGLFASVSLALTYIGLQGKVGTSKRFVLSAIAAGSGFLALSSGALLAILLQLGLFAWAWIFRTVKARWWLLVGLFAVLYVAIDLLSNRSPIRVFMSYATFSAHTAYWRSIIFEWGMVNVWANPLFGIGLNDWVRPSYMVSGSMDNFWLVMAVRYGIPGFLLLAAGYLLTLARVIRRDFSSDPELARLRLAWVFTFVGLTFTLCTVHVWTNIYSFVFFMFGAGVWLVAAEPRAVDEAAPIAGSGALPERRAPARAASAPSGARAEALAAAPRRPGPVLTRFPARPAAPRPSRSP